MALKDYPDWVLVHKAKGKEIRCINGKYYLYLVHTQRVDGKVKKFTDKYLGRITQEDGLIPPSDKPIEYVVKEYGLTAFIFSTCDIIINSIIERFPVRHPKLISLAILKYFFNNNLDEFNNHYVSIIFPNVIIKNESNTIQNETSRITSMFNHAVTKVLEPLSLTEFKAQISSLYIVGVKDKWTVASYNDNVKALIDKYKIKLEIYYAKSKQASSWI